MLLWILPILHLSLSWRGPWPFNSSLLGRARACFAQENRMKWYVGAVSCLQVLVTTLHMAHNFDSLHNCRLPLPTQQHSDTLTLSSLCRGVLDSVCVSTAGRSKHRQTWSDHTTLTLPSTAPHLCHAYQASSLHSFFTDTPAGWSFYHKTEISTFPMTWQQPIWMRT